MPKPQSRKNEVAQACPGTARSGTRQSRRDSQDAPRAFHADQNDDELLAGDEMIRAIVRFLQPLR